MTLNPSLPVVIDSTQITCFRNCPRKFRNEFIYGLRPPGRNIHLHAGACFASAIERVSKGVHLEGRSYSDARDIAEAKFYLEWGDVEPPARVAKSKDRVWEAVEEYFRTWPPESDHVRPYISPHSGEPAFEFTFSIPLDEPGFARHPSGQPFMYSGRFDMLGDYLGEPVVRDEKTTGSIGQNWSEQWSLRNQFMGYCWACQWLGIPVETVVVRGIGILKTDIKCVEAIKPFSKVKVERWYEQLRRDVNRLRQMWDEGHFEYNFADACTSYGNCMFMAACESVDELPHLEQFEEVRWNPLHKDPTDGEKEAA